MTTQSNIELALQNGSSLAEVDSWLDRELAQFFAGRASRTFLYLGRAEIAVAG